MPSKITEKEAIFRGDFAILKGTPLTTFLDTLVFHSFVMRAKEITVQHTDASGRITHEYYYEYRSAIHGLATKKNPDGSVGFIKMSDWFENKCTQSLLRTDPAETTLTGTLKSPVGTTSTYLNNSVGALSTFFQPTLKERQVRLEAGTIISNATLELSSGNKIKANFKLPAQTVVTEITQISDNETNTRTFILPPSTLLARMLPIHPDQEVPHILAVGKSDYLQMYEIIYPYAENSPWRCNQSDNPLPEQPRAFQFGSYWLPPHRSSTNIPLPCLYDGEDVDQKYAMISHRELLKAFNDQRVPYAYGGVGNPFRTVNSNSVCSFMYHLLTGSPKEFFDVPSNSLQYWKHIGMYNNPLPDPDTFIARIKGVDELHELACQLETWLNKKQDLSNTNIPCP